MMWRDAGNDAVLDIGCVEPVIALPDYSAGQVASAAARWRTQVAYRWRHRRALSLDQPRRFTELVQWRKLHDRNPLFPQMMDKVAVKAFVRDRIGDAWITPTWWHGTELPIITRWRSPFVVKSRHGCFQNRFVFSDDDDWAGVRRAGARWVGGSYGRWLDEWGYAGIERGLLVEPFIGSGRTLPIDYKFYVFHGRVAAIQVHLDRASDHRWLLMSPDWQPLSRTPDSVPQPAQLVSMIAAAETLGAGFDFVRVDLYDVAPRPRFGEMSFYPGSGLDPFDPVELDDWLGQLWRGVIRYPA